MLREEAQQFGAARHLEIGKIKTRGDGADDEGVALALSAFAIRSRGLPMT